MSYGSFFFFAASRESSIGFANASPTITILVAFLSCTCFHNLSESKPRLDVVITVPPNSNGRKAPNHIPVPCINGQPTKLFIN